MIALLNFTIKSIKEMLYCKNIVDFLKIHRERFEDFFYLFRKPTTMVSQPLLSFFVFQMALDAGPFSITDSDIIKHV